MERLKLEALSADELERLSLDTKWVKYSVLVERIKLQQDTKQGCFHCVLVFVMCLVLSLLIGLSSTKLEEYEVHLAADEMFVHIPFAEVLTDGIIGKELPDSRGYLDVRTKEEYFMWLNNVLLGSFLDEAQRRKDFLVHESHVLMWGILLRQIRVKHHADDYSVCAQMTGAEDTIFSSFPVPSDPTASRCYPSYSSEYESKDPISFSRLGTFVNASAELRGVKATLENVEAATQTLGPTFPQLEYHTGDALGTTSMKGYFNTYPADGYVLFIPRNTSKATRTALGPLLQEFLLDDPTDATRARALVVTVSVYNGNTRLFSDIELMLEISETGALFTSYTVVTAAVDRTVGETWVTLVLVVFLLLTTMASLNRTFVACAKRLSDTKRRKHAASRGLSQTLKSPLWQSVDLVLGLVSLVACVMVAAQEIDAVTNQEHVTNIVANPGNGAVKEAAKDQLTTDAFCNYKVCVLTSVLATRHGADQLLCALLILLACAGIGIMKDFRTPGIVVKMGIRCVCGHLFGYVIWLLLMLFSFAITGWLVFGPHVDFYATLDAAPAQIAEIVLGHSDIEHLTELDVDLNMTIAFLDVVVVFYILVALPLTIALFLESFFHIVKEERLFEHGSGGSFRIGNYTLATLQRILCHGRGWQFLEQLRKCCRRRRAACSRSKKYRGLRPLSYTELLDRFEAWKRLRRNKYRVYLDLSDVRAAINMGVGGGSPADKDEMALALMLACEDKLRDDRGDGPDAEGGSSSVEAKAQYDTKVGPRASSGTKNVADGQKKKKKHDVVVSTNDSGAPAPGSVGQDLVALQAAFARLDASSAAHRRKMQAVLDRVEEEQQQTELLLQKLNEHIMLLT